MKSFIPGEKDIQKQWHVVDAEGQVLGRLATRAARLLTGKDKPIYTPFLDTGDHVIIINAGKVRLTGNKLTDKFYRHHTGYPGGLREISAGDLLAKNPGKGRSGGRYRDAAQIEAGPGDEEETEGIPRAPASAPGAAAERRWPCKGSTRTRARRRFCSS